MKMSDTNLTEKFAELAKTKGYHQAKHHIFLCTGNACASQEHNLKLWEYLKEKTAEMNNRQKQNIIARSKTDCLRICAFGPLALLYPHGAFIAEVNETKIDNLLQNLAEDTYPTNLVTYSLPEIISPQSPLEPDITSGLLKHTSQE